MILIFLPSKFEKQDFRLVDLHSSFNQVLCVCKYWPCILLCVVLHHYSTLYSLNALFLYSEDMITRLVLICFLILPLILPLKKSSFSVIYFKSYAKLIGRFLFRNGNGGVDHNILWKRGIKPPDKSAFLFPWEWFFIPIRISNIGRLSTFMNE